MSEEGELARTMSTLETVTNAYTSAHGVLSLIVCALGIPMNVLNITVLTRKNMRTSVNCILMWLAIFDLLTMVCYIPFSVHFYCLTWNMSTERNSLGWMTFLIFHVNFTATTHTISIWLGVTLAIFRYKHIFSPAKGHLMQVRRLVRARVAILLVVILSVLIMIPNYLMNRLKPYSYLNTGSNTTDTVFITEPVNMETADLKPLAQASLLLHSALAKFLPCILMVVFGGLLVKTLRTNIRMVARPAAGRSSDYSVSRFSTRKTSLVAEDEDNESSNQTQLLEFYSNQKKWDEKQVLAMKTNHEICLKYNNDILKEISNHSIGGGNSRTLKEISSHSIGGGNNCTLKEISNYSIGGGNNCTLKEISSHSKGGGNSRILKEISSHSIGGGNNCTLKEISNYSIGGSNNRIPASTNKSILAGTNKTTLAVTNKNIMEDPNTRIVAGTNSSIPTNSKKTTLYLLPQPLSSLSNKQSFSPAKLNGTGRGRIKRHQQNARTTRMLLVVITLFLVTELPQAVLIVLSATIHGFFMDVYVPLGDIMDMLALANNGINFLLYCIMSRDFRVALMSMMKAIMDRTGRITRYVCIICHRPRRGYSDRNSQPVGTQLIQTKTSLGD